MSGLAVPALAIASYVRRRDGAASSAEILEHFRLSPSTLRRRRPELARLGVVFIEDGNRSLYATRELAHQVPTKYQPEPAVSMDNAGQPKRAARPVTTSHDNSANRADPELPSHSASMTPSNGP